MRTDVPEEPLRPEQIMAESVRWLRFVARWALLVGLMTLTLPMVLYGGVGQQAADAALSAAYVELVQAVRSPSMYRVGWTLDAIVWLIIGGSLLSLAGILRQHAPIQSRFIAAYGIAQVTGSLGSFLRLNGISDLAARYATAALNQQAVLRESYLTLWGVINACYYLGILLQGVGFLLAASGVFSLRGFPRLLAVWLALPGVLAVVQFILVAAGTPFSRPLTIFGVIVGNVVLNIALAIALWCPSPTLVAAVTGEAVR